MINEEHYKGYRANIHRVTFDLSAQKLRDRFTGCYMQLEEFLQSADLLLTGEGKLDRQIEFGKAISGVALLAEKHEVPVIVFTGSLEEEEDKPSL